MAVNNSLAKSNQKLGIAAYLTQEGVKNQINNIVGGKDGNKFLSSVISAVTVNPSLQECTNQSILSAALLGQSLNLSPSPQLGHYYMVPYDNKGVGKVAQFQLGYKGYIQLAIRSGYYKKLNVIALKKGELKKYDPLNEDIEVELIEDPDAREEAETTGYYAFFEYTNGFRKALYWSKAKMEKHAERFSPGYRAKKGYTFWEKDFDAMAYKTMLRQLISKWGIMSIDLQTAFDADNTIEVEDGSRMVVDTEAVESPQIEKKTEAKETSTKTKKVEPDQQNEAEAALFGNQ